MKPAQFFEKLKSAEVQGVLEFVEGAGDPSIRVDREQIPAVLEYLRDDPDCLLDQLSLLSGVQYDDRFECVYHILSTVLKHDVIIKAHLDKEDPHVPTASAVHPTADWHERETYDLIGIVFDGHPDLRRIYLPDDWVGHPLRRDYVFPTEFNGLPLNDLYDPDKPDPTKAPDEGETQD
ncbi:MAG: NADH-quinone oxidoreductase subunit C [Planctomycetota bacterium]